MLPPSILDDAHGACNAGISVIPIGANKRPQLPSWQPFQAKPATSSQVEAWFADGSCTGMAVICGAVSGGLEVLDIETADTLRELEALIDDNGMTPIWQRISAGYRERAPGGGIHILYRADALDATRRLAVRQKPLADRQHNHDTIAVIIEVRGEGQYAIAAPSHGAVHPTNKPYVRESGSFATIATLTAEERESIHAVCRMMDESPAPEPARPRQATVPTGEERPGDRFNRETRWDDLLPRYGWQLVGRRGKEERWLRPGKDRIGSQESSATSNHLGTDTLKVFSSSTPLSTEGTHDKFAVYAMYEHGGDFQVAARALGREYWERDGRPDPRSVPPPLPPDDPPSARGDDLIITANHRPAPEFPLHVLPPQMRPYVERSAYALSVPVEMIAAPMLGIVGALVGNRLHLNMGGDYNEYACSFIAVVARPGTAKTPALDAAKRPLEVLQAVEFSRHEEQTREYQRALDVFKKDKKNLARPIEPARMRHYMTTNTTIEALVPMLAESPGIAIIRDEMSGWVDDFDSYKGGKGSERQQFLSLWSSTTVKVDRKSNGGSSLLVTKPVVCAVGGIQPDLARKLATDLKDRDGFVERMLAVVPDVGRRTWQTNRASDEDYRAVASIFARIDALTYPETDDPHAAKGHRVALPRETERLWWEPWVNQCYADSDAIGGIAGGFLSKMTAYVPRLALILHTLWNPEDPRVMLSPQRMRDAIELGEYFRQHTERFLPLIGSTADPGAVAAVGSESRTMNRLRDALHSTDEGDEGWVSRGKLMRKLGTSKETLTRDLKSLRAKGLVEMRIRQTATKPVEEWRACDVEQPPAAPPAATPTPTRATNTKNMNDIELIDARLIFAPITFPNAAGQQEEAIRHRVEQLATLTAQELADYQQELEDADPSDPELAFDREAWHRFQRQEFVA